MTTIHEQIDDLLAADLQEQLSASERSELHAHLVECADCRRLHKEHQLMNTILSNTFEEGKPDLKFEQRMLGAFRQRVPDRGPGVMRFLLLAMRSRATQIAAAAALLLALVQTGRMITGEGAFRPTSTFNEAPASAVARGGADSESGFRDKQDTASAPAQNIAGLRKSADMKSRAATDQISPMKAPRADAAAPPPPVSQLKDGAGTAAAATVPNGRTESPALEAMQMEPQAAPQITDTRKLIRNGSVELEVRSFEETVQKITGFAAQDRGYVATTNSQKQENGKLRGQMVVKVLPENLDRFVGKLRGLGELKNQALTTEDVTKQYLDTDSRLKNAHAMEQRLLEILKKKSEDINDLLAVEKELGRVREEIERMQGELKFIDTQVQFATVTIQLAEKDMNEPAAFLLKEHAHLSLYTPDVERVYNDIKSLASPKVQITNATLDRENTGRISARISMLIAPEESDGVIAKTKAIGRVENFQVQTERIARGGEGMSENARTDRDKVELNVTISRDEQEQSLQQTSLRIRTSEVNDRTKQLRVLAEKQGGRVRSSSFSRDPNGREFANLSLRVPMKNYSGLMESLNSLGRVENVSVSRQDRSDAEIDEQNAPADVSIQVYSQGNIVSQDTGLIPTLRRTLAQGVSALMWSVRMIGVALAFFAPWMLALAALIWGVRRILRARRHL